MLFTFVFLSQQTIVLFERKGTTFTISIVQEYLAEDFTNSKEDGNEFPVAFFMLDSSEPDFIPR